MKDSFAGTGLVGCCPRLLRCDRCIDYAEYAGETGGGTFVRERLAREVLGLVLRRRLFVILCPDGQALAFAEQEILRAREAANAMLGTMDEHVEILNLENDQARFRDELWLELQAMH